MLSPVEAFLDFFSENFLTFRRLQLDYLPKPAGTSQFFACVPMRSK
jgi:hypothetical protein